MLPRIDLPRAIHVRGAYMRAVAAMQTNGIPIDPEQLERIERHRDAIKDKLILKIDADYGVYDGRVFKVDRFEAWTKAHNLPWPRTDTGRPALDDETFRLMEKVYPELVGPLRQLRAFMSENKRVNIGVGADGRAAHPCSPSPLRHHAISPRNSCSGFLLGIAR